MRFLALPLMLGLAVFGSDLSGSDVKKPKLSVKANPAMAISPARVVVSADISGGPDDYEDYYCAGVEWDWGDDTRSNNSADCDPYEAGKSAIKRRFTTEHTFRQPGAFRVAFRLKQKDRVVGTSTVNVQVRTGLSQF